MADLRPCKVCNFSRQKSYGLVVSSLDQLKEKGGETLGFPPQTSVSVVLEDDGTIVADDAYFLCLPANTKFMLLHDKEAWGPTNKIDGGTAWLSRESVLLETDEVDTMFTGTDTWQSVAAQLKQDLASIILLSDAELQTLVDVPCDDLASALGFSQKKAQALQDTLQTVLDRREESRQSKELLQLYLKTMEREQEASQEDEGDDSVEDETDGLEVDSGSGFSSRTLMVLKGKTSPETRLSNQELQMVVTQGAASMEQVLGWDADRTAALVQACDTELQTRLQKVQALKSLSTAQSQDAGDASIAEEADQTQAKRSK